MVRNLFFRISFILSVISLVSIGCSSDHANGTIITYKNNEAYQKQIYSEIRALTSQWNITSTPLSFPKAEASSTWFGKLSNISLTGWEIKNIVVNMNNTAVSRRNTETTFTTTITGTGADKMFKAVLKFNYDYSCFKSGKGEGEVVLSSDQNVFEKVFDISDEHISRIHANISSNFQNIESFKLLVGDYSTDSHVLDLAKTAFQTLLNFSQQMKLKYQIENQFDNYYKDTRLGNIYSLITYPHLNILMSLENEYAPIVTDDAVVSYFDGTFEDIDRRLRRNLDSTNSNPAIRSIKNALPLWNNFNASEGEYQNFLHQDLFRDLLTHLSEYSRMDFNIQQNDLPENSNIELSIETLGLIYPDILQSYPADTEVKLTGFFDTFSLNTTNNTFVVTCTMNTKISTLNDDTVFEFTSQLLFNLEPVISMINTFNLDIIDGFSVVGSVIPSQYKGVNQLMLNDLLSKTLNLQNQVKPFRLLTSDYPLNINYEKINQVRLINGYGLLIAGVFRSYGVSQPVNPNENYDSTFHSHSNELQFLK